MDVVFGFVVIGLVIALYFLPGMIALHRRHPNATAIFVFNLFLGWTFLGWVIALVWSLTNERVVTAPAPPRR